MKYKIAIPTYKRKEVLKKRTLSLLKKASVPNDDIYIFFASEEDKTDYNLGLEYKNQIVGVLGLTHQRNFIINYFANGEMILWMDDDLKEIKTAVKDPALKGKQFDQTYAAASIQDVAVLGFKSLIENKCSLFGIYPVNNKGFLKIGNISTDLKYIIGCLYGTINNKELFEFKVFENNGGAKEDFLRTCMVYEKENKVVRLNAFTALTDYYDTAGGLQSITKEFGLRKERDFISMEYICKRFEGMAFPNIKNDYPEIKLKDKRGDLNQITLF